MRPNENNKRLFPSQAALCCVSLFCISADRPIHLIMHINQLPDKNTLLTSEMCYCIYKLLIKERKIKERKVAFFSPSINTNLKYKWHQNCQRWEIRGQSYALHTPDVWQFFASNQLGNKLTDFYSHLRLSLHEPGYWNPSKCTFLSYYLVWDINISLIKKHKISYTEVLSTSNVHLQNTKNPNKTNPPKNLYFLSFLFVLFNLKFRANNL